MKNILIGTVITSVLLASSASAQNVNGNTEDVYKTIETQTPRTQNVCQTVDVPIYGTVGGKESSTADVLAGAIFGGLLGNAVGGGKGKDATTLLGAIAGADIANKKGKGKQGIVGYNKQQQCQQNTTYTVQTSEVYSHSYVTFYLDGKKHRVRFNRY
jgi:outer membrane lipoprotein SlyB